MEKPTTNIKEMLFYSLRRWRSILLSGLILAVVFGVYSFQSGVKAAEALQQAIEDGTVVQDDFGRDYEKAWEKLNEKQTEYQTQSKKSTELQKQINEARRQIADNLVSISSRKNIIAMSGEQIGHTQALKEEAFAYLNGSVLMQAAENLTGAVRVYTVILPGETADLPRDPADQIVTSFSRPAAGEKRIDDFRRKYGLTTDLTDELYDVTADPDANMIRVSAFGRDEAMAKELLDAVCGTLEEQKPAAKELWELRKTWEAMEQKKDAQLFSVKNTYRKNILEYENNINSYEMERTAADSDIGFLQKENEILNAQIRDLEKEQKGYTDQMYLLSNEIAKMEEKMPSMVPDTVSLGKSAVKFSVIGFAVGAALLFALYIVVYIIKPMLRVPEDISTLYGCPVLGVLNRKVGKNVCAVDKWIMKAERRGQRPGDDEIVKTAAVSIANTAPPGSQVAVMTTLKENSTITQISSQLKGLVPEMRFVLLTEGVSRASNVDELSRCDAVVLLEEREVTSMEKLTDNVARAELFGKRILGAIVA